MLINQPAAFAKDFIEKLNENLAELKPSTNGHEVRLATSISEAILGTTRE